MLCTLCYIFLIAVVTIFLFKSDPKPLCGVYSQKGKWFFLKYHFFRALYKLRQRQKITATDQKGAGYGRKSKADPRLMERPQKLPDEEPQAVDAVYFNASNAQGFYLVAATARRQENLVQTTLILRVPEFGIFEMAIAPDTHWKESEEHPNEFAAGGLWLQAIEPMKKWRLQFKGKMLQDRKNVVQVEMDFEWTYRGEHFDFDTDMHPEPLAEAIAREPWSREFFKKLQDSHQTHYEQFGDLKGKLHTQSDTISFSNDHIEMRGVRDHSYGNIRDWTQFHRYTLHFFHLEDGTCIQVGVISMPYTMSRLEMGYISTKHGKKIAIKKVNFDLIGLGENQDPPATFRFDFVDEFDKTYRVECEILDTPKFYLGKDWECVVFEQMCTFKCNDQAGWGFAEWQYRNIGGRQRPEFS